MKSLQLLTLLTIILGLGLITSCEENTETDQARWYPPENAIKKEGDAVTKSQKLWGHWVCANFIDLVKIRRTIRGIRNRPMFLEIVFKPEFGDSVLLVTGYTNIFAPYTKKGKDSIIIKNISAGKNIVLVATEGLQRLELLDSVQGENNKNKVYAWSYTKTSGIKKNKKYDVYSHINASILSGTYRNNSATVSFTNTGEIRGWNGFENYKICSGGDCFMLTRSPIDIITFNKGNQKKSYALWLKSNDSLYFYNLIKKGNGKHYNYQPEGIAFAFKKLK